MADAAPPPEAPLVTAVVTTYNRPNLARRAIASVLAQTYSPLEVLVVEDGSRSGIEEWLDGVAADRVRYVRHARNRGLAAARNTGLSLALGRFVAFLDDDDEWKPDRIRRQIELYRRLPPSKRARVGAVYSRTELVTRTGVRSWNMPLNSGPLKEAIARQGPTTLSSTVLFPRNVLREVGGYDESLASSIDHDIWMSLATAGFHVYYVDEPLVRTYDRRGRDTMMTDTDQRIRGVEQFVEKWSATYSEWLGAEAGARHLDAYYARVLSALVAANLGAGRLREAATGGAALWRRNGVSTHGLVELGKAILRMALKKAPLALTVPRRLRNSAP